MEKEKKIKGVLVNFANAKKSKLRIDEAKIDLVAKSLRALPSATKDTIKAHLMQGKLLTEVIDWTDTDFWIDNLVEIVNDKK